MGPHREVPAGGENSAEESQRRVHVATGSAGAPSATDPTASAIQRVLFTPHPLRHTIGRTLATSALSPAPTAVSTTRSTSLYAPGASSAAPA